MMRGRRMKANTVRNIEGSIFIAPWVLGFLIFMAFPLGYSLYMSFHNIKILATGITAKPAGWTHYSYILLTNGGVLYDKLIPFLQQSLFIIPIIVIFALLIAILLNQKFLGRTLFRIIFFLPVIFSTGQVVREFMSQGQGGLGSTAAANDTTQQTAGSFSSFMHISDFVNTTFPGAWSRPIMAILNSFVLILWYSGVQILIFLAGRQTISKSVYEAARIDGANPWEVFWKITLPGMTPFIMLNIIYTVVELFTFPTNPIMSEVNGSSNFGQASALAWIYFVITFIFLAIFYLIFNRITRLQKTN